MHASSSSNQSNKLKGNGSIIIKSNKPIKYKNVGKPKINREKHGSSKKNRSKLSTDLRPPPVISK